MEHQNFTILSTFECNFQQPPLSWVAPTLLTYLLRSLSSTKYVSSAENTPKMREISQELFFEWRGDNCSPTRISDFKSTSAVKFIMEKEIYFLIYSWIHLMRCSHIHVHIVVRIIVVVVIVIAIHVDFLLIRWSTFVDCQQLINRLGRSP